ncbi:MAG: guanine deaminase [Pseudomonadota bacterium]
MKAYRARVINPVLPTKVADFKDGLLVIDKTGHIVQVGEYSKLKTKYQRKAKLIDLGPRLIIPGFVDCHLHLPQLDCRGKHGSTLLEWLTRYIFPAEKAFKDLKVADDVGKRFFKKLILNGTTTSSIYTTIHAAATDHAFKLAQKAGVRAIIGKVMMDRQVPPALLEKTNQSLAESEKLAGKWHNSAQGRLRFAFTPRFAPTCSKKLLQEVGKLVSKTDTYLQSHIAETQRENKKVLELFPEFKDPFAVFEKTGCAGPRTILGHAIYLSDQEYKRMAQTQTKIAHCPTSNLFLKSGRFPLTRAETAGITIGFGTDVGAGTSMCMLTEMRHADYTQTELTVTPTKAFYLATLGGAHALSMQHEIGNFEKGKKGDFLVLDINEIDYHYKIKELNTEEVLSLLMYRGHGNVVKSTFVQGRKLNVDVFS